jgi:S-disulfanyl-L-cysteine oxidoreductase SoxD
MKQSRDVVASLVVVGICALVTQGTFADSPSTSQWSGVYAAAQAQRGELVYSQNCAICHGPDLLGGEMAPPLIGGTFQSNWNEQSLGDLYERIRVSMPLNAPGTLSSQQVADAMSYLLSKDGYPSGANELPTQVETLKEIKFLSTKP